MNMQLIRLRLHNNLLFLDHPKDTPLHYLTISLLHPLFQHNDRNARVSYANFVVCVYWDCSDCEGVSDVVD